MGGKGEKRRLFRNRTLRHSHLNKEIKESSKISKNSDYREEFSEHKVHTTAYNKKRHVYKRLLRIHHDFPPGIAMLLVFSFILGALYILLASMFSFTVLLGTIIEGALSRFLNIIMIVIIAFMIFGISKKKMWAYHLSIWVFSFIIINSVVSMFLIKKNVPLILDIFVSLSFFFILMMNMTTLWYIKSKKEYFLHHYHPSHMGKEDKTFIFTLTGLWFAFILTAGVLGNEFYTETTHKTDVLFSELQKVYPYSVEDYCMQKTEDRDLCLLTAAVMYEKTINSNLLCKDITSQFYKYSCFKAMKGDFV